MSGNSQTYSAALVNFTATPDKRLIRPQGGYRHILFKVSATAPVGIPAAQRSPISLALVLDRSGSMAGGKLETAKVAAQAAIGLLGELDEVAVVVYDDQIEVIQPRAPVTPQLASAIVSSLSHVLPRGSTALHQGWLAGCHAVAPKYPGDMARCFLLTDGLANVGETDPETIASHAAEVREAGVITSTFGVGADYDEGLLGPMATAGGGQFHHLRHATEISSTFMGELSHLFSVVATQVRLEIELQSDLMVDVVSDYWAKGSGPAKRHWTIAIGDLATNQMRPVVVRFGFPPKNGLLQHSVFARLFYTVGGVEQSSAWQQVDFSYASNEQCSKEARDREVMHWVGLHHAWRAEREGARLNRQGDFADASRAIKRVAHRLSAYAGDDMELMQALDHLRELQNIIPAPMEATCLKEMAFRAQRLSRAQDDYRTH